MERQTLHEHPPVYHVCQQCAGQGCAACSDLCILDGDLDELGPDFTDIDLADWVDETGALSCESQSPINGVIGTTADDYSSIESRLAHVNKLAARFPFRSVYADDNRTYLEGCGL